MVLIHEADPRFSCFDFRSAYEESPADLRELLDSHESLPFRRRGYERDGMLRTVIERVGFKDRLNGASAKPGVSNSGLAPVPTETKHIATQLEAYHERPVLTSLVGLLLLSSDDEGFTTCVLVHGMGGTGKTVTAVAAVQDRAIRAHFYDGGIFWLTVGADAVGEKIQMLAAMLYQQLTGKSLKAEDKDEQQWHQTLVGAMSEKTRALVVLDDPWMSEQARWLNPIDGSQTEHRLLVTTRIRDLVPKATRVELPLMGKDEAVALLLDLAGVEKASFMKERLAGGEQQVEWPPDAAYAIAEECALLPITLTIAAQVIRSWGKGWHIAVLPLLREEQSSSSLTVEERVIGAGLKALERNKDGAAVRELFHMFAVTMEDFVHPMPVIELLWRSCCASESEKGEGSLTTRLKVRQWTQLLVDHSLLLGSSSEGIHVHDIVLTYLRKRLEAAELRAEQCKVVEGLIAVSHARMTKLGRGLQDTGATVAAFDGEEVDWYCSNVGSYHVTQARDQSVRITEDDNIKRWVLNADRVLVRAVALAVGKEGLAQLVAHYTANEQFLDAARVEYAATSTAGRSAIYECHAHVKAALELVVRVDASDAFAAKQLELDVLASSVFISLGEEKARVQSRIKELLASQSTSESTLQLDPFTAWQIGPFARCCELCRVYPANWDTEHAELTEDRMFERVRVWQDEGMPLLIQAVDEMVGARREALCHQTQWWAGCYFVASPSERTAAIAHELLARYWGKSREELLNVNRKISFGRHHEVTRSMGVRFDLWMNVPVASILEHAGDVQHALEVYRRQLGYMSDYLAAGQFEGLEGCNYYLNTPIGFLLHHIESDNVGQPDFRPELARQIAEYGCTSIVEVETWVSDSAAWATIRQRHTSSRDGLHHMYHPTQIKADIFSLLSISLSGAGTADASMDWLDALPTPTSTELLCCHFCQVRHTTTRTHIAEVLEQQQSFEDALTFARADIDDPFNASSISRARAFRVVGRCHAALGYHAESRTAFESALQIATMGRFLLAEVLALRELAMLASAGGDGAEAGWAQVEQAAGRMEGAARLSWRQAQYI